MSKNLKTDPKIKLEIVKRVMQGESPRRLALEYFPLENKGSKDQHIRKWVNAFKEGGFEKLSRKVGGPKKVVLSNNKYDFSKYRLLPGKIPNNFLETKNPKILDGIKKIKAKPKNERYKIISKIVNNYPNKFSVTSLCKLFNVDRKIYYWSLKYKPKPKGISERSEKLQKLILKIYEFNEGVYGYQRICKILKRDFDVQVSPKCVYYHMKKLKIKSIIRVRTNRAQEVKNTKKGYRNLIKRDFKALRPNEKWFTDITYVQIRNGWAFLSAIIDTYDNSIVSYVFGKANNNELVLNTIKKAVRARDTSNVILHSDHGFQYTSNDYRKLIATHKITPSMSGVAKSLDNQPIEAFWGIIKTECIYIKKTSSLSFEETSNIIDKFMIKYRDYRPR